MTTSINCHYPAQSGSTAAQETGYALLDGGGALEQARQRQQQLDMADAGIGLDLGRAAKAGERGGELAQG